MSLLLLQVSLKLPSRVYRGAVRYLERKEHVCKFCLLCTGVRHLQLCATTSFGTRAVRSLSEDDAIHYASVYVSCSAVCKNHCITEC